MEERFIKCTFQAPITEETGDRIFVGLNLKATGGLGYEDYLAAILAIMNEIKRRMDGDITSDEILIDLKAHGENPPTRIGKNIKNP